MRFNTIYMNERYSQEMKPKVSFETGENIYILIRRLQKVLNESEYNKFKKELEELNNYNDVIKIAKKYVNIV